MLLSSLAHRWLRRLSVMILGVLAITQFPLPAEAQGGGYTVPSTFWIQEPIANLSSSGMDNPENNGSPSPSTQYIRMNGTTWASAPLEPERGCFTWKAIDNYQSTYGSGTQFLYTWYRTPAWAQPGLATDGGTATATISGGAVSSIHITNGGSGYTSVPLVSIQGGGGTCATAQATLTGGVITGISVTAGGSGYTSAPTVTIINNSNATEAPTHLYSVVPGGCVAPMAGQSVNDCYVKEFWTAFMEHVCGVSSPPSDPVSTCWIRNFEMWNEFNDSGYWTDSAANLAQMGEDAATIIRQFCSNCMISVGSTSAGGAGTGVNSNFYDPGYPSGQNYASYDWGQKTILSLWQGASMKPDFVSWHPYTSWQEVNYTPASGSAYYVAEDPSPFPETASSGNGSGADIGQGGTGQHVGSVLCASVTNEYSVAWTDGNGTTKHYGACSDPIAGTGPGDTNSQIYKMTAIAQTYKVTVDGTTTGNPILWATEGGYSNYYNMQGTDDEIPETTSMTRRNFLRRNYIARYLISLAGRGVLAAIPYSYDLNGNTCYMAQYGPSPSSGTWDNIKCALSSGKTWGTGETSYNSDSSDTNYPVDGQPYSGQLLGLTASGNAYNTVYKWISGEEVYCNNEDTTNDVYHCDVYTPSETYIGTIFWEYQWDGETPDTYVPPAKSGSTFNSKWYVDETAPESYTNGTENAVSGEPVFFYNCNVAGPCPD